jgi:hypothetical protein
VLYWMSADVLLSKRHGSRRCHTRGNRSVEPSWSACYSVRWRSRTVTQAKPTCKIARGSMIMLFAAFLRMLMAFTAQVCCSMTRAVPMHGS